MRERRGGEGRGEEGRGGEGRGEREMEHIMVVRMLQQIDVKWVWLTPALSGHGTNKDSTQIREQWLPGIGLGTKGCQATQDYQSSLTVSPHCRLTGYVIEF